MRPGDGALDTLEDWAGGPVAAARLRLARIARRNPQLRAFVFIDSTGALRAAEDSQNRWACQRPLSLIDGMPIGIKANIAVRGWPFHAGLEAHRHRIADCDAACVARLRAGGAVLLGLLNMDEAALGDTTDNPHFGRTENPVHPGATAGGSSGGCAAAVAAGLCEAALGTDTLGSVRIPAAFCGVVGHKPPHGVIATEGVVKLAPDFDSVGILANTVGTARALRDWLGAGKPLEGGDRFGCVGVFTADADGISPAVAEAFACTVEKARELGFDVRPVPRLGHPLGKIARAALLHVELAAAAFYADERARNPCGFSRGFLDMLHWAEAQTQARREAARAVIEDSAAEIRQVFAAFDVVLMPTTPGPAFAFGTGRPNNTADFTMLANVAGLAATAFPAGGCSVQAAGVDEAACLFLAGRLV